ncbi:hypothetical protein B0T25DRAFT_193527 [Lasiosphaeria hispida]|uniref:Uncharacterized protein n=1 Tax=Lasiosphaeria hispida TaxID=260671 RepID=A0AAJ0MDT9_9PEZI|nr:hypothetical protein B0T25DRAFT_193527 [Lasiosphaeria hispida]
MRTACGRGAIFSGYRSVDGSVRFRFFFSLQLARDHVLLGTSVSALSYLPFLVKDLLTGVALSPSNISGQHSARCGGGSSPTISPPPRILHSTFSHTRTSTAACYSLISPSHLVLATKQTPTSPPRSCSLCCLSCFSTNFCDADFCSPKGPPGRPWHSSYVTCIPGLFFSPEHRANQLWFVADNHVLCAPKLDLGLSIVPGLLSTWRITR